MYHVVKSSRAYNGFSYNGPALRNAGYVNREKIGAEFFELPNAIACADELAALNPVGFDVYNAETRELVHSTNWSATVMTAKTEKTETATCASVEQRTSHVEAFKALHKQVAFVGNDTHLNLAHAILHAAHVHQASFDKAGSDAETEANQKENDRRQQAATAAGVELPVSEHVFTFYEKHQRLNIREACEVAAPAEMVQPVYLLLQSNWNDAIAWAEELVGPVKEV